MPKKDRASLSRVFICVYSIIHTFYTSSFDNLAFVFCALAGGGDGDGGSGDGDGDGGAVHGLQSYAQVYIICIYIVYIWCTECYVSF